MLTIRTRATLATALIASGTALVATVAGPVSAAPTAPAAVHAAAGLVPRAATTPSTFRPPTPTASSSGPVLSYPAPTNARVTAVTPTSVTLAWDAPVGGSPIVGYAISYRKPFDSEEATVKVGLVTTVTITEGIQPTREYYFRIQSLGPDDRRGSDVETSVVTPAGTTGDVTPPSRPEGLTVTGTTAKGVALTWSASTDDVGVAGYDVYYWDGYQTWVFVTTATGPSVVAPFRVPTAYGFYYLYARDAAGNLSRISDVVQAPPLPKLRPQPDVCRVAYRHRYARDGRFVAEVTVTNTAATPVDGWYLWLPLTEDQRVDNAWNATFTYFTDGVGLRNAAHNRVIPAGGHVTIGLAGTSTTGYPRPATAALNTVPCGVR